MTEANNNSVVKAPLVQPWIRMSITKVKTGGIHHLVSQRGNYTLCGLKVRPFASGKTKVKADHETSESAVGNELLCKHCERIEKQDSAE